jgi:Tfp pilus assembly PilM family ATPase
MSALTDMLDRFRPDEIERMLGLRPASPRVTLEIDRTELALARFKPNRRGRPLLETCRLQPLPEPGVPASLFDQEMPEAAKLAERLGQMFDRDGARPGRVALLLPDSVAKISLLTLPERPPSRRQLEEAIRFKMRRAVPFRLTEAALSYQVLTGGRGPVEILVALTRRAVVERFEQALGSLGCRLGLVDLCTPNVLNLCRAQVEAAARDGGDVALLNCTRTYFSLVLVRAGRLIFFRCKTLAAANGASPNGALAREVASSLSYYEEKLGGQGLGTTLVRTVATPFDELARQLADLPLGRVRPVDLTDAVSTVDGRRLEPEMALRFAPILGLAAGRS